jgi:hypothetical protein
MRKITTFLLFTALAYFSFIGVALASDAVVPTDGSLLDLAKPVYEAILGGQWWLAAMLGLILLTTAVKKYAPGKIGTWVNGEYGQELSVLLLAFGGAGATALLAAGPGAVLTGALAWAALKVAVGAAGGYSLLKALVAPLLVKLQAKAPAWMQPVFGLLLWVFSKPTATEAATAAGDAAVVADPAKGADGTVGEPKQFP